MRSDIIVETTNPPSADNTGRVLINPLKHNLTGDQLMVIVPDSWDRDESDVLYLEKYKIYLPSWNFIRQNCPQMAGRMVQEFRRIGGFIPYEPGFVYLIQAEGTDYYKIGKSINPDRRILQISPKMPFETRVIKIWRSYFMSLAEKMLHEDYADYRANGEWFELVDWQVASLLSYRTEEIKYAYTSIWCRIMLRQHHERYETSEVRIFDQEFLRKNHSSTPDISCVLDPQMLANGPSDQSIVSMNFIQFYLEQIAKTLDMQCPEDIAEMVRRYKANGGEL